MEGKIINVQSGSSWKASTINQILLDSGHWMDLTDKFRTEIADKNGKYKGCDEIGYYIPFSVNKVTSR